MDDLRRLLVVIAILAMPFSVSGGCNRDDDEDTTSGDDDDSSGGEDDDDDDDGGGGGDDGGGGGGGTEPEADLGETREAQCRPPRRPAAMSGSARRSFDEGVRLAREGRDQQARTAFQEALNTDDNAYQAAYNLGVLADRAGNANQAVEMYQRSLRIAGDYERAAEGIVTIRIRQNNVAEAVSFIQPLAERYRTNLALQALHAEVLVKARRFDDAWAAARRALRCDERFVPALIALIKASFGQGRQELAERILEQALGIQAQNAELQYLRGRLLMDKPGRLREALEAFERAVQLRPDYSEAHMALGVQYLRGGRYEEALQHLRATVELSPTLVAAHLNLGDAYRANKQWQQAKASFEKALKMSPELPQAHFNMGLMYMSAGAEFPGLDNLGAMQKAVQQFTRYRDMMGPRLPRDDPSENYLRELNRAIEREQRRVQREQQEREEASRGPREGAEGEGGGEE